MSQTLDIPFYAFQIHFSSGGFITVPLMHADKVFANESITKVANDFRKIFQAKVLEKGTFIPVLDQFPKGEVAFNTVSVAFQKAKNKSSYPDFSLDFIYYYNETTRGTWVVVPVLGIEAFVEASMNVAEEVEKVIKLEFLRGSRMQSVQQIVETIWYARVELMQTPINLEVLSFSALAKKREGVEVEGMLQKVAQKLEVKKQMLFGMEQELQQVAKGLKGAFSNNVLLAGPSGVGKTTLVWELVRRQKALGLAMSFWETTASTLIKELTSDTAGWQENIARLCKELSVRGDVLYIRNLMDLFEVGQYEGNTVSVAEYLRPYLASGEITLITECSDKELAKIDLKSTNYSSLFKVVRLEEPKKNLETIIFDKVQSIAKTNTVEIDGTAVTETVRLNKRYTPYAGFPGKPIRFLENIILNHKKTASSTITRSDVIASFCEETGMPQFMIDPEIPMKPRDIRVSFKQQLYGQDAAVDAVVDVFATVKTALSRQGKPIASFLFVGPTGVGKTEMAKIMANFMFGSRSKFTRFDMSEFSDPYAVLRLTGQGQRGDGLLTSAVRKNPFGVILFDEIEKAHPSFYDLLLQVLGEGRLSDTQGRQVNFCSTIIVMTSNIGAANLQHQQIGWSKGMSAESVQHHFTKEVEKHFRPEMFNRIDKLIAFAPLTKDAMRFVVEREMELFRKRDGIKHRNISLQIEDEVLEYLTEVGYDEKYGARYLQRAIREEFIIPLSKELNAYPNSERLDVQIVTHQDGALKALFFNVQVDDLAFDLLMERLSQNNQVDLSSELRRELYQVLGGETYVQMLSQLDMLKSEQKQDHDKFWNDPQKVETYTSLSTLKETTEKIYDQIEKIEEELALSVMDLAPYRTTFGTEIKAWEKDYLQFKMDLITQMYPSKNQAYISIYGLNPEQIFEMYKEIIAQKNWEISAVQGIWYNGTTAESYELRSTDAQHNFIGSKKKSLLCGCRIKVVAPLAYIYLMSEEGWVTVIDEEKKESRYNVSINMEEMELPSNMHRKDFGNNKYCTPRRILKPTKIEDTNYKINELLSKKKTASAYILSFLDSRIERSVDRYLIKSRE